MSGSWLPNEGAGGGKRGWPPGPEGRGEGGGARTWRGPLSQVREVGPDTCPGPFQLHDFIALRVACAFRVSLPKYGPSCGCDRVSQSRAVKG